MKYVLFGLSILLTAGSAAAEVVGKQMQYEVNGTVMKGYLAYDSAIKGKRPGVIVVHEWWGHNDYAKKRADMLAKLGYTAFALDMYGEGKQVSHPKDAGKMAGEIRRNKPLMLKRFRAAKNLLQQHKLTDKSKLAAIGYCFGGGVVLEVARSGEPLSGVVSFHGSLVTDSPATADSHSKTKVLVLNGEDDPFVKTEHISQFKQEMQQANLDFKFVSYPGAKHAFTNPEADKFGQKFNIPLAYHKRADEQSWQEMQKFFVKIFQ